MPGHARPLSSGRLPGFGASPHRTVLGVCCVLLCLAPAVRATQFVVAVLYYTQSTDCSDSSPMPLFGIASNANGFPTEVPKNAQLSNSQLGVGGLKVFSADGGLDITLRKPDGSLENDFDILTTSECFAGDFGTSLIAKVFEWDTPYVTAVLRTPTQAAGDCTLTSAANVSALAFMVCVPGCHNMGSRSFSMGHCDAHAWTISMYQTPDCSLSSGSSAPTVFVIPGQCAFQDIYPGFTPNWAVTATALQSSTAGSSSSSNSLSGGAIAGIVCTVVLVVIAAGVLVWYKVFRQPRDISSTSNVALNPE